MIRLAAAALRASKRATLLVDQEHIRFVRPKMIFYLSWRLGIHLAAAGPAALQSG